MMDVSMIDPSLLPDDTAGQMNGHDADDAEHDSEMDAEGEEEDIDMDAEGEWEEPEVDQDVYAPDQVRLMNLFHASAREDRWTSEVIPSGTKQFPFVEEHI